MKKNLFITAALLMASATYSFANADNFKPMTFAQHDTNSDGVLSKDEVRGGLLANFAEFDSDASGALSVEEFAAARMAKQGRAGKFAKQLTFAEMDLNSDGLLSKAEFAALKQHRKDHSGKAYNRPTFQEMDKNSDGVLAKEEVGRRLLAHFADFDTDANGTLSAEEFSAVRMAKQGRHHNRPTFQEMDTNGDGVLAKEEVGRRLLANFAEFDSDANGTLSAEEFAAVRMAKRDRGGKHHNRPMFEAMDTNGDGVLAKEEVCGPLLADFELLDTDGNGSLAKDELAQDRGLKIQK
ncbi:MAG: Ca2+-binding EF-hand superfamily protein [Psychromonas sp.]|jgi:Ca2+-binding EF-hand superfamily protein|uniref:EF-hand domain-containing protein n=1 Tax=Psychromonas sp. TaxID=1884585 RepID=UPI0039E5C2A7